MLAQVLFLYLFYNTTFFTDKLLYLFQQKLKTILTNRI
ncbi:hypothetical protein KF201_1542 [Lactococcus lactis subsp. lactis]|nr:hypothetical protein KF201_1542 [Lactococcus lactis subsp. lactis]